MLASDSSKNLADFFVSLPDRDEQSQADGHVAGKCQNPAADIHGPGQVHDRGNTVGSLGQPLEIVDYGGEGEVDSGVSRLGDAQVADSNVSLVVGDLEKLA